MLEIGHAKSYVVMLLADDEMISRKSVFDGEEELGERVGFAG